MKDMTQRYPEGQNDMGYRDKTLYLEEIDDYGCFLESESKRLGLTIEQYESFPYQFPKGTCFRYETKMDERCTICSTCEDERYLVELIRDRDEIAKVGEKTLADIWVKIPDSNWEKLDEELWLSKTYNIIKA